MFYHGQQFFLLFFSCGPNSNSEEKKSEILSRKSEIKSEKNFVKTACYFWRRTLTTEAYSDTVVNPLNVSIPRGAAQVERISFFTF